MITVQKRKRDNRTKVTKNEITKKNRKETGLPYLCQAKNRAETSTNRNAMLSASPHITGTRFALLLAPQTVTEIRNRYG